MAERVSGFVRGHVAYTVQDPNWSQEHFGFITLISMGVLIHIPSLGLLGLPLYSSINRCNSTFKHYIRISLLHLKYM